TGLATCRPAFSTRRDGSGRQRKHAFSLRQCAGPFTAQRPSAVPPYPHNRGETTMASPSNAPAQTSQELFERCTQIRQLMAAGNVNCHQIGRHYNYVVDNELAEKAGYKNAPEFFSQQLKELSRSTLAMYGAVARVFTEGTCGQYGMNALNLLM